jgi:glutamate--cysteine ligase
MLTRDDLRSVFEKPSDATEAVGLEIESAVLDPLTGRSTPYEGPDGLAAILDRLLGEMGGTPIRAGEHLIGLRRDDGVQFMLEHGGALEYASTPHTDIAGLMQETGDAIEQVAEVVSSVGRALVPGSMFPFTSPDDTHWMPKPYAEYMRAHFKRIGDAGALGATVMASTLSTQVTLDYRSEDDLRAKLAMQVAASPVAAAVFAGSPIAEGRLTGLQSYRTHCWQHTAPDRSGVLAVAVETPGSDSFIDWACGLQMLYRKHAGGYGPAPDRSFAQLMETGFGDETFPDRDDWTSLLSQVWTDVRLRSTLELRAADGPAYPDLAAVPAFWVGLTYHPPAREAAWQLLHGHTAAELQRAMPDLAANGLAARLGEASMLELGRELVALAASGLQARIDAGLEQPHVLGYLDPIRDVVETGRTFSDRCIERWEGDLGGSPARYVEAYRARPIGGALSRASVRTRRR